MTHSVEIRTVAVLDDNEDDREMTAMAVEAAGYDVLILPVMASIDDAVGAIRAQAQALVSDHNLAWGDGARFTGAALVNRCYQEGIPAVLVTGYMMDTNTSIREYRRGVAQLVSRSELDGDRLRAAMVFAASELNDRPPRTREPHAALVRVERVHPESGQIDVVVPQWDPHFKVSLPSVLFGAENLPADLGELIEKRFFAQVNTAAEDGDDLYFSDFQDAGDPPSDEELI